MPRRRKDFKVIEAREWAAVVGVVFMLAAGIYAGSAALIGHHATRSTAARAAAVSSQPYVYACFGDTSGKANTGLQEFAPACKVGGHLKRIAAEDVGTPPPPTSTSLPPTSTSVVPTSTSSPPVTTTSQPSGGTAGVCPTVRAPSTFTGVHLTETQAIHLAFDAGFHGVEQVRTVVGIGKAESALWSQARRWHPDFGCRSHSDVIGVQGPAGAWDSTHFRQLHSDRGWLQWSSHFHGEVTDAQADDPPTAAAHMFVVSKSGTDFHEWDTVGDGSAGAQRPSAATVCATVPATGC